MIGERIRELRGSETQIQWESRFGVTRNTIRRYESGTNPPDTDFIAKLCEAYSINAHWLITGEGPKRLGGSEAAIDEKLLVSVIEAIEEYLADTNRALPPQKKAQLILALYDMFLESEEKKVNKAVVIRLARLAA